MAAEKTNTSHNEELQKQLRMVRALLDENYKDDYISKLLLEKGLTEDEIAQVLQQAKIVLLNSQLKQSTLALWFIGIVWAAIVVLFINVSFVNESHEISFIGEFGLRIIITGAILFAALITRHMIMWVKVAKMETNN